MRKSIQTKIIILILIGILFSSLTIGGLGLYSFAAELKKSVISTMNLTCQEKAEELNSVLGRIEQSTEVMAVLSVNHLQSVESLQDDTYREAYVQHLCNAGYDIAVNTDGAIGIYLRLNPEIAGPLEGFYWLTDADTGELKVEPNTDISKPPINYFFLNKDSKLGKIETTTNNTNITTIIFNFFLKLF